MKYQCEQCSNTFQAPPSQNARFCNRACYDKSRLGIFECKNCWIVFSGTKSHKRKFCSVVCRQKYSVKENSPHWKGDNAGKGTKHVFLTKHYGKPTHCDFCKVKDLWTDWALKRNREYSHNREDYLRLCRSCHRKYDMTPERKEQIMRNLPWYRSRVNI